MTSLRLSSVLAGLLLAGVAHGHEGLHERIERVDRALADLSGGPARARLLAERGDLQRLHGDWPRALADLGAALELDPAGARAAGAELTRARVFLSIGSLHAALACADAHLVTPLDPPDAAGLELRARVLFELGRAEEAARDLELALAHTSAPSPDAVLLLARARRASGRPEAALAGLDEWIARLGETPALVLPAVELCEELGRTDDALARIDALAARSARREEWLVRRAEVLARAGRSQEACAAWEAARLALAQLDSRRAGTRAAVELRARVERAQAELAALDRRVGDRRP